VGSPVGTVVLVEGERDKAAVETLADRRGRDLAAEGVEVVAMGGVIGVRSGRKARYARLLVAALGPGQEPEPLDALLASL